jgi:hypothetical protein
MAGLNASQRSRDPLEDHIRAKSGLSLDQARKANLSSTIQEALDNTLQLKMMRMLMESEKEQTPAPVDQVDKDIDRAAKLAGIHQAKESAAMAEAERYRRQAEEMEEKQRRADEGGLSAMALMMKAMADSNQLTMTMLMKMMEQSAQQTTQMMVAMMDNKSKSEIQELKALLEKSTAPKQEENPIVSRLLEQAAEMMFSPPPDPVSRVKEAMDLVQALAPKTPQQPAGKSAAELEYDLALRRLAAEERREEAKLSIDRELAERKAKSTEKIATSLAPVVEAIVGRGKNLGKAGNSIPTDVLPPDVRTHTLYKCQECGDEQISQEYTEEAECPACGGPMHPVKVG